MSASAGASGTDQPSVLLERAALLALRDAVEAGMADYLRELERLVNVDSGSYTKAGVDEVGSWVTAALAELGARIERRPHDRLGDTIVATLVGTGSLDVVLIGHLDTVFDPGTAAARPFAVRDGRALGPGVSDMKAGLLAGIHALRAIGGWVAREAGAKPGRNEGRSAASDARATAWPFGRLVFVANADEEIGSPTSGPIIREVARGADVALVLESARANGDIVSARKGIVDLELRISGRAAHAGVEPEKGRSAVLEAAHKVIELQALNGRWPGVTVNAGVLRGGTRPNVVAEEAVIEVDVRAVERARLEEAGAAVAAIAARSRVPDTACRVAELGRHWPMERTDRSAHLVARAVGLAEVLGFPLRDAATGGASDANTTAGMGIPTLDGLGPVGGDDHAPGEYIELDSVVPRVTLLAGLLLTLARDPVVRGWRSADRRGDVTPAPR